MHKVAVVDEAASQSGIVAATLLVPPEWSVHAKNPSNGERVQMNSVILTDSAAYDPNGQVGSGSWTELQQER